MSPHNSEPNAPGIYDGLMFVSVAAMIAGIVFLVLELNEYGWQVQP